MRISDWSSDVCSSDLPRFSALPAHRPAILCEDAAGTAQSRGVDREAVRRQGRAIFRTSAAQPLRDRARARRVGALLYRRPRRTRHLRSEEHTSELQSLMRISYAVFVLKKKKYRNYA